MSAGFDIAGDIVWGTNGAIEAYVEALADAAEALFGADDRLTRFFRHEPAAFNMGAIVFLDEVRGDAAARARLLQVFDAATAQLRQAEVFTEAGLRWLEMSAPPLRQLLQRG